VRAGVNQTGKEDYSELSAFIFSWNTDIGIITMPNMHKQNPILSQPAKGIGKLTNSLQTGVDFYAFERTRLFIKYNYNFHFQTFKQS